MAKHAGRMTRILLVMAALAAWPGPEAKAEAQQSISSSLRLIVYPAKGQNAEKQNMDEGECYAWARQQTAIDPVAVAQAPAGQESSESGGRDRLKGAAGGAAAGAAIGAIRNGLYPG